MKHTKGNWELDSKIPTRVLCNGGDIHIDVRYYDHKEQEAESNAKLIAAAPELLEALELLNQAAYDGRGLEKARKKAQEAIKKATK